MFSRARASTDSMTDTEANSSSSQVRSASPPSRPSNIPGPMLAAGEELAEAARQALGVDMQFEDITEYVHPPHLPQPSSTHLFLLLFPSQLTWVLSKERKQNASSTPKPRPIAPRSNTCWNTTPSCARARRTTSRPAPSMISRASIPRSRSTSSRCMLRSSSRSMRARRGRR